MSVFRLGGGKIPVPVRKCLLYIGRNTLFIYLFHYIAMHLMGMPSLYDWFAEHGNLWIDLLAVIVPTIVAVSFSLLLKEILERSPLIMRIVFNKR